MEESLRDEDGLFLEIQKYFPVENVDLRTYSPLSLAFVGDAVYELVIRSLVAGQGSQKTGTLQQHASHLARAQSQAEMMEYLLPDLSEEEADYYRRGRGAKPPTMPKNATAKDYHKATGFETLMGYLYLTGQTDRMLDLIRTGLLGIGAPEMKK